MLTLAWSLVILQLDKTVNDGGDEQSQLKWASDRKARVTMLVATTNTRKEVVPETQEGRGQLARRDQVRWRTKLASGVGRWRRAETGENKEEPRELGFDQSEQLSTS